MDHSAADTIPEFSADLRPLANPQFQDGVFARMQKGLRGQVGRVMIVASTLIGVADRSASELYAAEPTAAARLSATPLPVAIIKRQPQTNLPLTVRAYSNGSITSVKKKPKEDPNGKELPKGLKTGYYTDEAGGLYYFNGAGFKPVTVIAEKDLPMRKFEREVNLAHEMRAQQLKDVKIPPATQVLPPLPIEQSPSEELVPADQLSLADRAYPLPGSDTEYHWAIPGITLGKDGEGVRAASANPPSAWMLKKEVMTYELMVEVGDGSFTWSFLVPLRPDIGDTRRLHSAVDVSLTGRKPNSAFTMVTDVIATESHSTQKQPRNAVVRVSMHRPIETGLDGDEKIPVTVKVTSFVAVPTAYDKPQDTVDMPDVLALRTVSLPPKKEDGGLYPMMQSSVTFAPQIQGSDPQSAALAAARLKRAQGHGQLVTGWSHDAQRLETRFMSDGNVLYHTHGATADFTGFTPLFVGGEEVVMPPLHGMYIDREVQGFDRGPFPSAFVGDQGQGRRKTMPALLEKKMSVLVQNAVPEPVPAQVDIAGEPMPVIVEQEPLPAGVQQAFEKFTAERTLINQQGKIAQK